MVGRCEWGSVCALQAGTGACGCLGFSSTGTGVRENSPRHCLSTVIVPGHCWGTSSVCSHLPALLSPAAASCFSGSSLLLAATPHAQQVEEQLQEQQDEAVAGSEAVARDACSCTSCYLLCACGRREEKRLLETATSPRDISAVPRLCQEGRHSAGAMQEESVQAHGHLPLSGRSVEPCCLCTARVICLLRFCCWKVTLYSPLSLSCRSHSSRDAFSGKSAARPWCVT